MPVTYEVIPSRRWVVDKEAGVSWPELRAKGTLHGQRIKATIPMFDTSAGTVALAREHMNKHLMEMVTKREQGSTD